MKLPYRTGDSFALPLGGGTSVNAIIVACEHHVVEIVAGEQSLHVFDEALVLQRWQKVESGPSTTLRYARDDKAVGPAHAERIIAAALGVAQFDDARLAVCEIGDATRLEALPERALLTWSAPLASQTLQRVVERTATHDQAHLRLHSGAASQAAAFAHAPVAELTLAGEWDGAAAFEHVRELTLDAPFDYPIERAFPNLRALRIAAGAKRVDLSALRHLHQLERLDLSHIEAGGAASLAPIAALPALHELRIARLHGLRSLEALTEMDLRVLCIEEQPQVESLASLHACRSLEQLELLGMWQHSIADLEWAFDLPVLVRAKIDIGGRRKNVELYRRARWAYPWPVFSGVRASLTARPE